MNRFALSMVLAAALVAVPGGGRALAAGSPPTRGEYVSRLEAICKPRAEATERTMAGVRDDIQGHRLRLAAIKFDRAGHIFGATVAAISAVPRPPADAPVLSKWFARLSRQGRYLPRIAAQLRGGEAIKAQHLTAAFIRSGNEANRLTLPFGFRYCRFKFSRFS